MISDRSKYEERRREFRKHQPDHYCPHCTSVLFAGDQACLECGRARPAAGWAPLDQGFDPCLGRTLGGRYLVTRFLGVGGTGNVYRAESLTILRQFAVKIIDANRERAKGGREKIRSRLEREVEALSRLRNPHIVPFYEVLELPGNFLAVVMDYIEGTTLEDLVHDAGPLGIARTCAIGRQIAIGVHEAHEVGMTHRDLKPDNIMIERLPLGDEFAHILDFGIVQLGGDNVRMTQGFLGTPLYASPEQAMGREVDRRSDIYSLGALFFFVLSGRPPFIGRNSFEVLDAHIRTAPPRLDEAFPGRRFPEAAQDLVTRMLAKAPKDRPQDLSEVITALDHLRAAALESPEPEYETSTVMDSRELRAQPMSQTAPGRPGTEHHQPTLGSPPGPPDTGEIPTARSGSPLEPPPKAEILRRGTPSGKHRAPGSKTDSFVTPTMPQPAWSRQRPSSAPDPRAESGPRWDDRNDSSPKRNHRNDSGLNLVDSSGQRIRRCAPLPDRRVVILDHTGVLWLIHPDRASRRRIGSVSGRVRAIATTRTAALLGVDDGSLDLVGFEDAHTRQPFDRLDGDAASALAVDPSGRLVVVGTRSGRVLQGHRLAGKRALKLLAHGPRVTALAVSAAGDTFAVAREGVPVELFTATAPHSPFSTLGDDDVISGMCFSNDGHILALVAGDSRTVHLHHAFTGHRLMSYGGGTGQLMAVQFMDDNELTGFSVQQGSLYSWDLQRTMAAVLR